MAIKCYILKEEINGSVEEDTQLEMTSAEALQVFADLELDYITLKSATKLWKVEVDDAGVISTTEIV